MAFKTPYSGPSNDTPKLADGQHLVTLTGIKYVDKVGKVVVTYTGTEGEFQDWLGYNTEPQAKRSYAYLCRLHEIAGLDVPKGSEVDDDALLAALRGKDIQINIVTNEKGYPGLTDFPCAPAPAGSGEPAPF